MFLIVCRGSFLLVVVVWCLSLFVDDCVLRDGCCLSCVFCRLPLFVVCLSALFVVSV